MLPVHRRVRERLNREAVSGSGGVWFPEMTECAGAGRGGLLVGGDVSVGLSLGGLPRGWGMGGVGDRGDAMRQGSWNQALHGGAGSRQPCCRCNVDQTWRKSETQPKPLLSISIKCLGQLASPTPGVLRLFGFRDPLQITY